MSASAAVVAMGDAGAADDATLPTKHLFFYASAQLGSSLFFHVPLLILMPFMTSLLAVPAALAGFVIFMPKIWVLFCDPMMGALSDRSRARAGRRRPFVLWGGIATALSFLLLFAAPSLSNPYWTGALVAGLYLIGSTAYSSFSVPYLAMAGEIAPRPDLVTLVTSWRMAANFLGAFVAGLAPALVQYLGGGRAGYMGMSACLAIICLLSVCVFYFGTRDMTVARTDKVDRQTFAEWRAIFRNRNFVVLLQTYFVQMLGIGVIQSAFAYFVIYQLRGSLSSLTSVVLLLTAGSLIAQPLWVRLARRYGKLATYRIAIVAMMFSEGMYLLPGPGDMAILNLISFCVGVSSAGYSLMAWSSMYDLVAEDAKHTGLQRAGAFTGIWSASEKIAIAVGVLCNGVLLQVFGFQSSKSGFIEQSSTALTAVHLIPGLVPATLLGLSLLLLARFRPPAA